VGYLGIVQNCTVCEIKVPDLGMGKTFLARNTVEVLVVENDVEKRAVHPQCIARLIINEPQFSEPVHEKANPRASGTDHFRQHRLTHLGDYSLGHAFLAEMSKQ
jgi:hypothetical protein